MYTISSETRPRPITGLTSGLLQGTSIFRRHNQQTVTNVTYTGKLSYAFMWLSIHSYFLFLVFSFHSVFLFHHLFQELGLLACSGSEFIFWNLWIYWTVGRTPWMGDRPNAQASTYTQDNTTQKHADTQTCLEWNSNAWSQFSSGRRPYVPQTARPLGPVFFLSAFLIPLFHFFPLRFLLFLWLVYRLRQQVWKGKWN